MSYDYNADNQQTSMSDGAGDTTNYAYNGDGQQTQATDPLGHTTTNTYDAQGRLLSATNALNGTVSYAYNLAGWQTSETDPDGNITQYAYNAAGELTSETNPLNNTQTFSYDAAGQMTAKTDYNGQETEYAYNESGWKTSETWLNSQNQAIYQATYTYDPAGRLTEEQDPNSIYDYSYNASGQLTQTEVTYPSLSTSTLATLSYGYDSFGNRTSLSDSLGGSLTYSYNGEHQMTGETFALNGTTGPQLVLSYDTDKRLQSITRTDGSADTIVSNYSYDSAYRLTNMTYTDTTTTTTLASYSYGYNTASQVSSYQDANSSLTYRYDQTGQLTGATGTLNGSSYSASWSYDANGNRNMRGYQIGTGNELLSDGTYSYTYDKDGNTLTQTNIATGSVTYYTWDYRNRLTEVKVEDKNGNVLNDETFTYDVFNRRIGVTLNGTQQLYTVYDGANPYIDFNGSGTLTERYLTDPRGLSQFYGQVDANGNTQWFLTDNIGSIRQVVDPSGNVLDAITYDPYGNIVNQTNAAKAPRFLYAGGAVDSITGYYQFGLRPFTPSAGRWLSQDPLGLGPDSNPYRYANNAPANELEPMGIVAIRRNVYIVPVMPGADGRLPPGTFPAIPVPVMPGAEGKPSPGTIIGQVIPWMPGADGKLPPGTIIGKVVVVPVMPGADGKPPVITRIMNYGPPTGTPTIPPGFWYQPPAGSSLPPWLRWIQRLFPGPNVKFEVPGGGTYRYIPVIPVGPGSVGGAVQMPPRGTNNGVGIMPSMEIYLPPRLPLPKPPPQPPSCP